MYFARWTFRLAGIYGLILLLPFYFLEQAIGAATVRITHPEYFYGFVGAAIAAQFLFLLIASDPARYRPAMLIAILGKISFGIPSWLLWFEGRITDAVVFLASVDLMWSALFSMAYVTTRSVVEQMGVREC